MKQFLKYFSGLFSVAFVVAVVLIIMITIRGANRIIIDRNNQAPTQRVFDYADKLTDEEEKKLEQLIAESEEKIQCDLVLVVIDFPVVNVEPGGSVSDSAWNFAMMNLADNIYDDNNYGYDKVHGDGALLLDNWYMAGTNESQAGSWLSTCGRVYKRFSSSMIDSVLDDVYNYSDESAYRAYKAYIDDVTRIMKREKEAPIPFIVFLILPFVISGIFISSHLKSKEGNRTTNVNTYTDPNSVRFNVKKDELINSHVSSTIISTSSGGGGYHSGGGGGHRSSGGVSHGGGGRRR